MVDAFCRKKVFSHDTIWWYQFFGNQFLSFFPLGLSQSCYFLGPVLSYFYQCNGQCTYYTFGCFKIFERLWLNDLRRCSHNTMCSRKLWCACKLTLVETCNVYGCGAFCWLAKCNRNIVSLLVQEMIIEITFVFCSSKIKDFSPKKSILD